MLIDLGEPLPHADAAENGRKGIWVSSDIDAQADNQA